MPVYDPKLVNKSHMKTTKNRTILEPDPRVLETVLSEDYFFNRAWNVDKISLEMIKVSVKCFILKLFYYADRRKNGRYGGQQL